VRCRAQAGGGAQGRAHSERRGGSQLHTGRLASSDRVVNGAFRQFGIQRVFDENSSAMQRGLSHWCDRPGPAVRSFLLPGLRRHGYRLCGGQ